MNLPVATIEKGCIERSNLAAYIDGELSSAEELDLEMHLAICESCKIELNEQKQLLQALDFALEIEEEIELPENFTKVVVANAESKVSGLRRPKERFQALFICTALFLLALLGLGAETRTVFETFANFAEKFLAVSVFVWNLLYDVFLGMAIILRSISHLFISDATVFSLFLIGFFGVTVVAISRYVLRVSRF